MDRLQQIVKRIRQLRACQDDVGGLVESMTEWERLEDEIETLQVEYEDLRDRS